MVSVCSCIRCSSEALNSGPFSPQVQKSRPLKLRDAEMPLLQWYNPPLLRLAAGMGAEHSRPGSSTATALLMTVVSRVESDAKIPEASLQIKAQREGLGLSSHAHLRLPQLPGLRHPPCPSGSRNP